MVRPAFLALLTVVSSCVTPGLASASPKFMVILDPGHGGSDTGAIGELRGQAVYEKDVTLAIAGAAMRAMRARGINAVLTRGDDRFVTLDRRTRIANDAARGASVAVFVSIHANSNEDRASTGAEFYVLANGNDAARRLADIENGKAPREHGRRPALLTERDRNHGTLDLILTDLATTANYADSVALACSVERSVVQGSAQRGLAVRDRGVRQALFYVLMDTHVPGFLFEPGFMSNPADLARLLSPAFQSQIASNLADGVIRWRDAQLAAAARGARMSGVAKGARGRRRLDCRIIDK